MENLDSRVKSVVGSLCEMAVSENDLLKEDLGFDSLSLVNVVFGLEEAFEVQFDADNLNSDELLRVSDLIELLRKTV